MSCRVGRRGPRKKGREPGPNLFHAVRSGRFLYASAILACADSRQRTRTLQPSRDSRAESDSTEHAIAIAFSFIGTSGFAAGKAGQVRYGTDSANTYVYADVNGDRVADFTLTLANKQSLTSGDFIL